MKRPAQQTTTEIAKRLKAGTAPRISMQHGKRRHKSRNTITLSNMHNYDAQERIVWNRKRRRLAKFRGQVKRRKMEERSANG